MRCWESFLKNIEIPFRLESEVALQMDFFGFWTFFFLVAVEFDFFRVFDEPVDFGIVEDC